MPRGWELSVTEDECNDNRLRSRMGVGLRRIRDGWGILGRGEMSYCCQLPQRIFPLRQKGMALFSFCCEQC